MKQTLVLLAVLFVFYGKSCQATTLWPFNSPNVLRDAYETPGQLADLAQMVCTQKNDAQLIGRISTIVKLANFFEESVSYEDLAPCREKYGASLKALRDIVVTSNDNVCSNEKVSMIEDFHRRFISTLSEDLAGKSEAPKMLVNFFAHYTAQVSRMCKQSIVPLLEQDISRMFPGDKDYAITPGKDFTGKVAQTMGNFFQNVNNYDDILLVWDLVDSTQQQQANGEDKSLIVDTVDETTGERVKLVMVSNNIKPLVLAQLKCRQKLRPVYSKIILPVARLADIGYSYMDEDLKEDQEDLLRNNKQAELWYRLTQFCEAILPIQFLQDKSLDEYGTLVITLSERAKYLDETAAVLRELEGQMSQPELNYEPSRGVSELPKDEDFLRTILSTDGVVNVRKVDGSANAQSRNFRRFMGRLVRGLKTAFTGNMKFSRKAAHSLGADDNEGQVKGDFALADIKSLLSKPSVKNELQKLEQQPQTGSENQHSNMSKRGITGKAVWTYVCILVWIAFIGAIIGSIVVSGIAIAALAG